LLFDDDTGVDGVPNLERTVLVPSERE